MRREIDDISPVEVTMAKGWEKVDPTYNVTLAMEIQKELRRAEGKPTRKDFEDVGRCIDRESGLDCGCTLCGRD